MPLTYRSRSEYTL